MKHTPDQGEIEHLIRSELIARGGKGVTMAQIHEVLSRRNYVSEFQVTDAVLLLYEFGFAEFDTEQLGAETLISRRGAVPWTG